MKIMMRRDYAIYSPSTSEYVCVSGKYGNIYERKTDIAEAVLHASMSHAKNVIDLAIEKNRELLTLSISDYAREVCESLLEELSQLQVVEVEVTYTVTKVC